MNVHAAAARVRTTCPYCGVGCGVEATPDGRGGTSIAGDASHPANAGRLCSKGSALGETLGLETRLLHPIVDGARSTWDVALSRTAQGLQRVIERYGPDAVAFYLSGQLLTEDYYVANKLMKGFIGSANVDTNSRLCMASTVAGHRLAFGSDTVPGCYEDLDEADLLVLVGSNAAWCHPVLYQRMALARERRGARIVTIDVRGTATTESADLALTIQPGMDGVLFSGLLAHLADRGAVDRAYVAAHTENFDAALAQARRIAPDVATTAARCGVAPADIASFFDLWRKTARVATLYSQGVNQSWQGTDKVVSILNCHLATGRIARPGMGPFSLTGQPNAMGGREVGGLANQLAAHMGFSSAEIDRVARFWRAPHIAKREGLKAVAMFDAIACGEIKALWIMGSNPAVSLPRADHARAALSRLDLLVISDNVRSTDTIAAGAHVLLPAAAWGEKDGTVTNSERRISRQRPFAPLAGEAKPDWWATAQVAARMGFADAFDYAGPAMIFREHAALSAFENDRARDFDIGGLAELSDAAYDALAPTQWPAPVSAPGGRKRMFADGRFFTPSGRARFGVIAPPSLAAAPSAEFPFLLNTGRLRDQWHTMTRTGLSPRLASHSPDPFVEVNPDDARGLSLIEGGFARVSTAHGSVVLRVAVTNAQHRGRAFVPIHWSDETGNVARVGALVHAFTDPVSGQPDSKAVPAALAPVSYKAQGFVLARARFRLPDEAVWAWSAIEGGYAARIATNTPFAAMLAAASAISPRAEHAKYSDLARGVFRAALIAEGRLDAILFLGPDREPQQWGALATAWRAERLDGAARRFLLSGKSALGDFDASPTICACFGVRSRAIETAIADGADSVAAIGARLKAGTNCGSCLPELRRLIAAAATPALAQTVGSNAMKRSRA
ncbi:molybdopterin-dependent oxidoreductase [Methylocapsa polymorpha]|uniref:Molybdopterin-dependent oxidoreductase n=1 Tax=Methylocapsa polymorpha TaxID=3080828 RepID=A0ABZ0HWU9_9HYPH|nr:molybdopterin-dependent oxidoreductase [Methylocapsa sp. RX1]